MNLGRKALKAYFKKGSMPDETSFSKLIDSTLNIVDDGFSKSPKNGLFVAPEKTTETQSGKLISFFGNTTKLEEDLPDFSLDIANQPTQNSLSFISSKGMKNLLTMLDNGNIGINNPQPLHNLDIGGKVAFQERKGTFPTISPTVPADGKWHPLISNLDGLHAFEIMAAVYGIEKSGRYAILHAIALSAFGKSKSKIRHTSARFGSCKNRIQLRWSGSLHQYQLEIRTRSPYEANIPIQYHITRLWDNQRATSL